MKQGTTAGTFALDARNGGAFTRTLASGLALNSWYNIWMVVNQSTDTYDLYHEHAVPAPRPRLTSSTPLRCRSATAPRAN